jgi:hypothetical protein
MNENMHAVDVGYNAGDIWPMHAAANYALTPAYVDFADA